MQVRSHNAIILDVKKKTFTGRKDEEVTFTQARIIDDENNYHEVTVPNDFDFGTLPPEEIDRLNTAVTIDIQEHNNKIKRRLHSIG